MILSRFQEMSPILLQLVWTIAWILDKSRKTIVFLSTSQRACHLVMTSHRASPLVMQFGDILLITNNQVWITKNER